MRRSPLLGILIVAVLLVSCAGSTKLIPERIEAVPEVSGKFTLYLYHFTERADLDEPVRIVGAIAIVDPEDDEYEFRLSSPDFSYIVLHGLSAQAVADTTKLFFTRFKGRKVHSAINVDGQVVGYETRLAHPTWIYAKKTVGASYRLTQDNKIKVIFRVKAHSPDRIGP